MEKSFVPRNYQEWRHCITVECGLELTPEFIEERISSLQDDSEYYNQQFVRLYGQAHHKQVLAWFIQARDAL